MIGPPEQVNGRYATNTGAGPTFRTNVDPWRPSLSSRLGRAPLLRLETFAWLSATQPPHDGHTSLSLTLSVQNLEGLI